MKQHDNKKKLYTIKKEAVKFKRELDYSEITPSDNEATTIYAKRVKKTAKTKGHEQLQKTWEDKVMHGKYPKRTKEADVDHQKTHQWLKNTKTRVSPPDHFTIASSKME